MGLTLAKVLGATSATSFEFAGETVNLTYRPAALTPKLLSELSAMGDLGNDLAAANAAVAGLCDAVVSLVEGWDLAADDSGTLYPIDAASVAALPFIFLLQVINTVTGDLKLGESPAATTSTDSAPLTVSSPPSSLAD